MRAVGDLIKKGFAALGIDLLRSREGGFFAGQPASAVRAVGGLPSFLQDLAARGFRPRHILDIGANRGLWSRDVRKVFHDARFTLIEPQVEMKPYLDAFCSSAKGSKWVNAGAGSAPGELPFHATTNTTDSTFLVPAGTSPGDAPPQGMARANEPGTIRMVPIITMDSLFEGRPEEIPELVKIDVEGFEMEVLKGATTLLGRTDLFAIEAAFFEFRQRQGSPLFYDIVRFMAEHGYSTYDFTWFMRRPSDGALGLTEVVFARNGSMLRRSNEW